MMKRLMKVCACLVGALALLAAAGLVALTVMEYRPAPRQPAERYVPAPQGGACPQTLTLCTWNIGYGGLGRDSDFFMDGGRMVYPPDAQAVARNLDGITGWMQHHPADVWLVQEVDVRSARSRFTDQFSRLQGILGGSGAFAFNYSCALVPFPLPPIGPVQSGLATFTHMDMAPEAVRVSLQCPFAWPIRVANLKRCLLVTRVPVAGTDSELVLVNLHLEAYEHGEGRAAQTRELLSLLEEEYARGHYVIAGGDFNQNFPGASQRYPLQDAAGWQPGELEAQALPAGWRYAADLTHPTCRLLDAPYSGQNQHYVIDGFILSPNVEAISVETLPLDFAHADHNPVRLQVRLLPGQP